MDKNKQLAKILLESAKQLLKEDDINFAKEFVIDKDNKKYLKQIEEDAFKFSLRELNKVLNKIDKLQNAFDEEQNGIKKYSPEFYYRLVYPTIIALDNFLEYLTGRPSGIIR